jgi:cation:H+ antiporter
MFSTLHIIPATSITFWYSRRKTSRCEHLIFEIVILLITLVLIVASSELFTNGVEWLGQRLNLSEGVVGSILAAVGTALPETLIPIVALVFFGQEHGAEVGIGAIAGAPFMLSTLTLGLCGLTCLLCTASGRREPGLRVKGAVIRRDLKFFIVAYCVALAASFLPTDPSLKILRTLAAISLVLLYPYYLYVSLRHEGEVGVEPEKLYLDRLVNIGSHRLRLIIPQIGISLLGIAGGAYIFVHYIQDVAQHFGVPPLLLSLIVSPIATEAPEKINSILWLRAKKDTLAIGNVTGALVFQSCFPVAFGVAFTVWSLDLGTFITGLVAIASASTYFFLLRADKLRPGHLLCGMFIYIGTLTAIISLGLYKRSIF